MSQTETRQSMFIIHLYTSVLLRISELGYTHFPQSGSIDSL